jgi:5'(3')-deoxyribonucleotidase
MQRIAVDMDGVLADVTEQYFRYHEKDFGKRKSPEEIAGIRELDAFPNVQNYLFTKGFFRTAPRVKDSREILAELNKQYEIFVVSAAMEFPQSLSEKQEWLDEHFPFITWHQIVFCGLKSIIEADVMIDDHFKNLDLFKGTTLLFTQPHNVLANEGRHKRVHSWKEIAAILL